MNILLIIISHLYLLENKSIWNIEYIRKDTNIIWVILECEIKRSKIKIKQEIMNKIKILTVL
jgi:hypothetical protein